MWGSALAINKARVVSALERRDQPEASDGQPSLSIARLRQTLVDADIARDDRLTAVLQALKKIPATAFQPSGAAAAAAEDVVSIAFLTALLRARKEEPVLQIGFGSGYETAILGRISRSVMVEDDDTQRAQAALARLARIGVGAVRWSGADARQETGPLRYAHIFVTGLVPEWPSALGARLRPGGRMVACVGGASSHYAMGLKRRDGTLRVSSYALDTLRPVGLPSR